MESIITFVTDGSLAAVLTGLLTIVGGAAVIASVTPTTKDDDIIAKVQNVLKKALDVVGFNFGKAKNKE